MYSDADRGAQHVREADEAYHLGAVAGARKAISTSARIIELARARAAPTRCIRATASCRRTPSSRRPASMPGLMFVGPPAAAIRAMGSKSASKAAMAAAGVPVAPGYHGSDQSPERLARRGASASASR